MYISSMISETVKDNKVNKDLFVDLIVESQECITNRTDTQFRNDII